VTGRVVAGFPSQAREIIVADSGSADRPQACTARSTGTQGALSERSFGGACEVAAAAAEPDGDIMNCPQNRCRLAAASSRCFKRSYWTVDPAFPQTRIIVFGEAE
jgi:hypothetical protein